MKNMLLGYFAKSIAAFSVSTLRREILKKTEDVLRVFSWFRLLVVEVAAEAAGSRFLVFF